MRIRLTLRRDSRAAKDLTVTVDGLATVSDVARELYSGDPDRSGARVPSELSLSIDESYVAGGMRGRVLDPSASLLESGLRPGSTVSIAQVSEGFDLPGRDRGPAAATLRVLTGPDTGKEFSLPTGTSYIGRGRDADVRLSDPMTSKRHARITVGESVEIADMNSANGLLQDGHVVEKTALDSSDEITLGDTTIAVVALSRAGAQVPNSPLIEFNRSPRVVPRFEVKKRKPPAGPEKPQPNFFPFLMLLAPLFMGGVLVVATGNPVTALFMLMMPLFIVGHYFDQKLTNKRMLKANIKHFREQMVEFRRTMTRSHELERAVRLQEAPSVNETVEAIYKLGPLLWTHRPEHSSFLAFRFGIGTAPTRTIIEEPDTNNTVAEFIPQIEDIVEEFSSIAEVPIVSQLRTSGAFGVAGPRGLVDDVARGLVLQMVGLHSPAELVLTAMTSGASRDRWSWVQWLPHVGSVHSPLGGDHLAAGGPAGAVLLSRLEDLLDAREAELRDDDSRLRGPLADEGVDVPAPAVPAVLVIVEDDVDVDRGRLTRLAERGADVGIHLFWVATSVASLPAACRDFMLVDGANGATTGQVRLGRHTYPVSCESLDLDLANQLGRMLTPVVDVGKPVADDSNLPRSVSYVTLAGKDLMNFSSAVADRWRENNSVAASAVANRKSQGSLRALVGSKGVEPMYLDLKNEGPHALVGGTTGAGKSEFLQSWVLGMAAAYSPDRISFLFVDYKGGAAFADCLHLPHTVGLVTDLSPHLVRRALTSLRAELHYREHLLNRKKAKDLLAMERDADPETPPYLVIIVDEFAALATEVPEFVDGVVDVAQRGRSLGLHLILATQRPAGVIKDNLRANTNLRIALRMADAEDSTDILGTTQAAYFDPSIPGRGAAKTGPGRIQGFQSGFAGGWTTEKPPRPRIDIVEMTFGSGTTWEPPLDESAPSDEPTGPNDIARMVATISAASEELAIPEPRKPWLAELATTYDFSRLPNPRSDEQLLLGVIDDPAHQAQPTIFYEPDSDGNMAVLGTGGSGKSAALRGLAIAGAVTARGGPVQVYAIDAASAGLRMLEELPHVGEVIDGDDSERVGRLLRMLRETVDERAARYAKVRASTIVEYRAIAEAPDEPRILLLVDGMSAFRESYEFSRGGLFDLFLQIATDGRPVGVHLIVSGDRPASIPTSLSASIQRRLVLRLASEDDYVMLDEPKDVLTSSSPPGRGLLDGSEVQLAVLGGNSNLAVQAREVHKLRNAMLRQGVKPAPGVRSLPENVQLESLPHGSGELAVIGVDDETLLPAEVVTRGSFLIGGPPGTGRTVAMVTLAYALRNSNPEMKRIYIGTRRSAAANLKLWDRAMVGTDSLDDEIQELIEEATENPGTMALFLEGVTDFTDSMVESDIERLITMAIKSDHFVVGESETSTWSSAWTLGQPFKSGRRGLLLNPGDIEGDSLLNTSLGRIKDGEVIPGRGYLIGRGKVRKLQVALPPESRE